MESSPLRCPEHQDYTLSHYCVSCGRALCAKCIKPHNLLHKEQQIFAEIELLEDVINACEEKVGQALGQLHEMVNQLKLLPEAQLQGQNAQITNLLAARERILNIIRTYSTTLEQQLRGANGATVNANDISEKILKKIDFLERTTLEITSVETINLICQTDFEGENQEIDAEIRELQQRSRTSSAQVVIDQRLFGELEAMLKKYVRVVEEGQNEAAPATQNSLVSSQQTIVTTTPTRYSHSVGLERESEIPPSSREAVIPKLRLDSIPKPGRGSTSIPSNLSTAHKEEMKSSTSTIPRSVNDFEISIDDYFLKNCTQKQLHFFQHRSKYLHLLNLDTVVQGNPVTYKFAKLELAISFRIPRWHKSIVTPDGLIFLTGGIPIEGDEGILEDKNSFVYDENKRTLVPVASMQLNRSGHAITFLGNSIYVIGGFLNSEGEYTETCERYDIPNNRWLSIAPLNFRANNCCACTFNNKYIYKFGGKIHEKHLNSCVERYDPTVNKWTTIEFAIDQGPVNSSQSLDPKRLVLSAMSASQINQYNMIVFGGTLEDYSIKSNQCYLLTVHDENNSVHAEEHNLTFAMAAPQNFNNDYGSPRTGYNVNKAIQPGQVSHSVRCINQRLLPYAEGFWCNTPLVHLGRLYALQNVEGDKNRQVVHLDRKRVLVFSSAGWENYLSL
eukprot:TRINITY_DN3837_c0_g1_i5.p1 TRINITY_DN3837_c0_g1~~TRINITY_DN3837_c0_g1_i5.p1  ORF type:complete len:673 (+),score=73.67 TRINITY_DN3837_c0_g1_i5:2-2020(+)